MVAKVAGQSYNLPPAMGTASRPQAANNSFIGEYAKVNDAFTESIGKLVGRNTAVGTIYVPAAKVENLIAFNPPDNNKAPLI
jgi:hypothetical protein